MLPDEIRSCACRHNKEKEHKSVVISLEGFVLKTFILYFKLLNFVQER
jgi:hypothetical protein